MQASKISQLSLGLPSPPWEDIEFDDIVSSHGDGRFWSDVWTLPPRLGATQPLIKFALIPWNKTHKLDIQQRRQVLWACKCYMLARMRPRARIGSNGANATLVREWAELRNVMGWLLSKKGKWSFSAFNNRDIVDAYVLYSKSIARNKHHLSRLIAPLISLFDERNRMPEGHRVSVHPFNGVGAYRFIGYRSLEEVKRIPRVPDDIAVPMLEGCIRFLRDHFDAGIEFLRLWQEFEKEALQYNEPEYIRKERVRRRIWKSGSFKVGRAYVDPIVVAGRKLLSFNDIHDLKTDFRFAAIIVIACFSGPRIGEILGLLPDCLEGPKLTEDGTLEIFFLKGVIYKNAPGVGEGRQHRWVAGARPVGSSSHIPVVNAVNVLRQLREVFLPVSVGLVFKFHSDRDICTSNVSAHFDLPLARIVPDLARQDWHFSSLQFRKTCAHFIARRRKNGLGLVGEQFGHMNLSMSLGYAGDDVDLNADYIKESSEEAASELLAFVNSGGVAGPAGDNVNDALTSFRGVFLKEEDFVDALSEGLRNSSLVVVPGEWGACFYRASESKCGGRQFGPNFELRTPDACLQCKNLALSEIHRPFHEWRISNFRKVLDRYPNAGDVQRSAWKEKLDASQACIDSLDELANRRRDQSKV